LPATRNSAVSWWSGADGAGHADPLQGAEPPPARCADGDDNAAGLRLAERLVRAGLELVEFRGRYVIREVSPRLRSPAWAAREAMVAAGMATAEDLRRWDRAFEATARHPATLFAPMFTAIGRRPAHIELRI
jgi:hypothetical protein